MSLLFKRLLSSVSVPKGYKKYVKEVAENAISSKKLIIDELRAISAQYSLQLKSNSLEDISSFWFQHNAPYQECLLDVITLSKISGDGIAYSKDLAKFLIVPFTLPGDRIVVSLKRHYDYYAEGKLIRFEKDTSKLEAPCKYFGSCSGCQLQRMPYSDQLNYKKDIIKFAFQNQFKSNKFDQLIQSTTKSPLEFNYRTKLTPHFDQRRRENGLAIGLNNVDSKLIDIDRCEIATETVNLGLLQERKRLQSMKPKSEGTLSIRESYEENGTKTYKVGSKDVVTEKVNGKLFRFPIYTFFQNNDSILPLLIEYIESHLSTKYKSLIDAYCGSGFFSISLSRFFKQSIGIEISSKSIEFAKINSELNNLSNVKFVSGTASNIFGDLQTEIPSETCVLIDPSRKGSDIGFLKQLAEFRPGLIIYVSCNVYSQSRDLYDFLETLGMDNFYRVKEIRGFDFFPQTKHVESILILELANST